MRPSQRVSVFDTSVEVIDDEQARRRAFVSYRTGEMVAPVIDDTEALQRVVGEFSAAIREDRVPRTDGRSGLRVLKVLTAIQQSMASDGSLIPLDLGI